MTQNQFLELGVINTLKVDRLTPHGAFLIATNTKDVLLPQAYVTDDMTEGSLIDVFLYTDSEDRLVATTLTPKAKLDEFGIFEVIDVTPFGAFVEWGLPKDLLVPVKLQKTPFRVGDKKFLKVIYDEKTHRLVGSEKTGDFFQKYTKGLKKAQKVEIIPILKTPLGYKCIVEQKYEGLIYHNEIFEKIILGTKRDAFIKNIRKDGKLDLILKNPNIKNNSSSQEKILTLLNKNNKTLPYNYKSDPELIKEIFNMSKKEFKRSLTQLQNANKIIVKETGIYLI